MHKVSESGEPHSVDGSKPVSDLAGPTNEQAEEAIRTLISFIGDDPYREGLEDTPRRVASVFKELFNGYDMHESNIQDRVFSQIGTYRNLVLIRDIPFNSHCEHHMMLFFGLAHVAYLPVDRIFVVSEITRLIDLYAHRLQSQERLCSQVAGAIDEVLKPRGVALMMEAEHTCMSLRGVQKLGTQTVTTQFSGLFRTDPAEQLRFIQLVRSGGQRQRPCS